MTSYTVSKLHVSLLSVVEKPLAGFSHPLNASEHHIKILAQAGQGDKPLNSEEQVVGTLYARLVEHDGACTLIMHTLEMREDQAGNDVDLQALKATMEMFGEKNRIDSAFFLMSEDLDLSMGQCNMMAQRYAPLGFGPVEIGSNMLAVELNYPEEVAHG